MDHGASLVERYRYMNESTNGCRLTGGSSDSTETTKAQHFLEKHNRAVLEAVRSFRGGGNSNIFMFTPKIGEMIQFDEHIFQMGWFNHQLVFI